MTQISQSRNTIISCKNWYYDFLLEYCHFLLSKFQPKSSRNHYFLKKSQLPSNPVYIRTFARNHYPYDDVSELLAFYQIVSTKIKGLTINHFYNLITYFKSNHISNLSLLDIYDKLEITKKQANPLTEKKSANDHLKFLKKIGETNHD